MHPATALWQDVERIRSTGPLVHNITNYVVMNSTANALLSIGASPVMAHAREEVQELAGIAGALVLNIGTLSPAWIEAMRLAGATARERGIPVVLDPVGAGASTLRTETSAALMTDVSPGIVRGNASEIIALAQAACGLAAKGQTKGVDSTHASSEAVAAARALARSFACVVVVSGATDYVTDGTRAVAVDGGDSLMPRVTGMGCTATAIIGAFAAVNTSGFTAAVHAMGTMAVCGEMAGAVSQGPGSFQQNFLDALYGLCPEDVEARFRARDA
ncbi:Hydroxyethylthiazole kinase [Desulfovibrio sp. X2]|uniref:hydroxyethylthiazole kinase n=1 Tax=Desulfovibrio sp. X2 TaxID=941449 RepID=UPI0003587F81|nr:hydroxyethylthiazole kinase [Desulfovibrio sp. X2]EPR44751.1 Hydroxyethylthiazole kinase [Desulfovibrio sp. X2]